MKIFLILTILSVLLLAGCSRNNTGSEYAPAAAYAVYNDNDNADYEGAILEIAGPDFAAQIQEILFSRHDFLGRTIRYEGQFMSSYWQGEIFYFVARLGGGCCGFYGLEVYLNDISPFDDETWVEVTGVLEEFYLEVTNQYLLRLNVITLLEL